MQKQCDQTATEVFSTFSFLSLSEIDDLTKYEALCIKCYNNAIKDRHTAQPKINNEIIAKVFANAQSKCQCTRDICHFEF